MIQYFDMSDFSGQSIAKFILCQSLNLNVLLGLKTLPLPMIYFQQLSPEIGLPKL